MVKKKRVEPTARQIAAAQAMADGMNQAQAALVAGLSNRNVMRTKGVRQAVDDIASQRAIAAKKDRYSLHGALRLYEEIADSGHSEDSDRLRAQARIDALMGLEAPAQKETGDREGLMEAVAVIQALGLSARALSDLAKGGAAEQSTEGEGE